MDCLVFRHQSVPEYVPPKDFSPETLPDPRKTVHTARPVSV